MRLRSKSVNRLDLASEALADAGGTCWHLSVAHVSAPDDPVSAIANVSLITHQCDYILLFGLDTRL